MRSAAGGRTSRFHALARAVSWHRRKLAVVAAMAAVLTGVNAALPPDPPTVEVVRTTRQLAGGVVLGARDLALIRVPEQAAPDGVVVNLELAIGQTLTAPIARGQIVTALDVVPARHNVRSGRVVAPLRLADADVAALLGIGDAVDVVAADTEARAAAVVARGVRIVGLPPPEDPAGVGGSGSTSSGALVLVEVDTKTAILLAQAAVTATLSVVLR